jgi:hypothetical protein
MIGEYRGTPPHRPPRIRWSWGRKPREIETMSQYFFAVLGPSATLKGGKRAAAKRDRIARKIDRRAGYTYYYDTAERRNRGWGYCENRGEPFDAATAKAIETAWTEAGV